MGFFDKILKFEDAVSRRLAPGPVGKLERKVRHQVQRYILGKPQDPQRREGPKLDDLSVQSSAYGASVPSVLAPSRLAGEIIWSTPKVQTSYTTEETIGGGGGLFGGGDQKVITTNYRYSVSMAISFGDATDGAYAGIAKFWFNGELVYNVSDGASLETFISSIANLGKLRIYTGALTQTADSLIVAKQGVAPAYRGVCYAVFEDLQLETYNNSIPNVEAELIPAGTSTREFPFLDTPSQFDDPTYFATTDLTIMNDGMLAFRRFTAAPLDEYAIRNPFNLSAVRVWTTGFIGTGLVQPRINQFGDLFTGAYYWRNGGGAVKIGLDVYSDTAMDLDGRFMVVCRYSSSPLRIVLVIIETSGIQRLVDLPSAYSPSSLFYGYNGFAYISLTSGAGAGPLLKVDINAGVIVRQSAYTAIMRHIVVAADESVFWSENTGTAHYRLEPTWTSSAVVYNNSVGGGAKVLERFGRDWKLGGVWLHAGGNARRYSATGALLESHSVGIFVAAPVTHPSYPDRVYWIDRSAKRGAAIARIAVAKDELTTAGVTLATIIHKLCARAGLEASEYDASTLTDVVGGYVVPEQMPARGALQPLIDAFNLQVIDTGTRLEFVKRGSAPVLSIPAQDMMIDAGTSDYSAVQTEDTEESELPLEVAVRYRDTARNYLADSQYDRRLNVATQNRVTMDFQVGMTPTQARRLASVRLFDAWAGRKSRSWALSRKYARLVAGDVVTLPLDTGSRNVLITRIRDEGNRRVCGGRDDESAIFTQLSTGAAGAGQSTTVSVPSPTNLVLLDVPLLRDSDDDYGLYVAAAGALASWNGAALYKSVDGGATYADASVTLVTAAAMGTTSTALGDFAGGNVFDELSSVDVALGSGVMASISAAEALQDVSDVLIGNEIVACRTRTLVSTGNYRLSGFLRGRYGTGWAMNQHVIGERVVVLSTTALHNVALSAAEVGAQRFYKGVSFGSLLSLASPLSLTYTGERLKPRAPVALGGGRNAVGDIIGNWLRSARRTTTWQDAIDVPLDESAEQYRVRVFAGAALVVTGVTKAVNAEFTVTGTMPAEGEWVYVHSVGGMVQLNERSFQVLVLTAANKFTINEDSSGWAPFTSGGSVLKLVPSGAIDVNTPTFTYTGAQQTTDYGGLQSPVRVSVRQISARVGEGRERTAII